MTERVPVFALDLEIEPPMELSPNARNALTLEISTLLYQLSLDPPLLTGDLEAVVTTFWRNGRQRFDVDDTADLMKPILDGLQMAGVYHNDRQLLAITYQHAFPHNQNHTVIAIDLYASEGVECEPWMTRLYRPRVPPKKLRHGRTPSTPRSAASSKT